MADETAPPTYGWEVRERRGEAKGGGRKMGWGGSVPATQGGGSDQAEYQISLTMPEE